jgi:signal transduction histidine kinase
VIFEKFRQSTAVLDNDGLTREYSGTGLGLSIVREMCKLLGGEITFESQLGVGSIFKVRLPWSLPDRPRFSNALSEKLDALAKPPIRVAPPIDVA